MLLVAIVGTVCAVAGSLLLGEGRHRLRPRSCAAASSRGSSSFSVHQFDRFSTASLITRTTNDTTQVQQVLIMLLTMVITAPMMAIGGVMLALSQDAAAGAGC